MNPIPLVRAGHLIPFAEFLHQAGSPVERLLGEVRLPTAALDEPDTYIPTSRVWQFVARAAHREGLDDLALHVGRQTQAGGLGRLGTLLESSPTLLHALETFCRQCNHESSHVSFSLAQDRGALWFCHRGSFDDRVEGFDQVHLYVLTLMTAVVRWFTGSGWQPHTARLAANGLPMHKVRSFLPDSQWQTAGEITAIRIEPSELGLAPQTRRTACATANDGSELVDLPQPPDDFVGSLRQSLAPYLRDGALDIALAADVIGISVRTLQRRLAELDISYKNVLDQARFEAALPLLGDPGVRLTDIAFDLGYSDPAHFTRAFRRMAGVSPWEYRRQQVSG
ncbi:MAG: AraC family transcriptional regulator ligand-binding domain-containing protein [Pseudomonadota bacterium]|nr:MAG: AraC family transcriptional regulator ligand-binding domain-containing protein [Pseudomonadota bacterium]